MPDEPTGTPPTETPGQKPVIQDPPIESPTLPPVEPPVEQPPIEQPPEMTAEERRDHDMRSWIGRRDAELRAEIQQSQQATLEAIQGITPAATPTEAPDPTQDADAWFDHKIQTKMTQQSTYNDTLIKAGTAIVQQDELVKANPKLAEDIYKEVQSGRVQIDRTLPPEMAARMAVVEAKNNILSKQVLNKPNPLAANVPTTAPMGSVQPPAAPATPAVKAPEMSKLASKAAARWGFTAEQQAEALKDVPIS